MWVVLALALAGCGDRHAPSAATPAVVTPAPTPTAAPPLPAARACVTRGAPFAVARSRTAMTRRSVVTGDRRALDPLVFRPRGGRCARPLVVFSHGHHGDPASCARICRRLAGAGFVVVAPRHEDRDADRIPLQAGERVDDVLWVLDHLRAPYDRGRIGIAGHSFGGVTAGEAASQDPRLRAVVSLAGTGGRGTMTATTAPTLIVAGTRDTIETAAASRASAAAIPDTVPHELVVLRGAAHGDLLDGCGICGRVESFLTRHLLSRRAA